MKSVLWGKQVNPADAVVRACPKFAITIVQGINIADPRQGDRCPPQAVEQSYHLWGGDSDFAFTDFADPAVGTRKRRMNI